MVTRAYLLEKPPAVSPAKAMFDERVVPAAINAAAAVEVRLESLAQSARLYPLRTLALAFGSGCVLASLTPQRRPRRS